MGSGDKFNTEDIHVWTSIPSRAGGGEWGGGGGGQEVEITRTCTP